jgi:hypothetical protein
MIADRKHMTVKDLTESGITMEETMHWLAFYSLKEEALKRT